MPSPGASVRINLGSFQEHSVKLALLFRSRKIAWTNGTERMLWRVLKNGVVAAAIRQGDVELGHLLRAGLLSILFGVLRDHGIVVVTQEDVEDSGNTDLVTPGFIWVMAGKTLDIIQQALGHPMSKFLEPERGPYHVLLRKEARLGISEIRTHPLMSRLDLGNTVFPVLSTVLFNVVRISGTSYDPLPLITPEHVIDSMTAGYMILSAYARDPTIKGAEDSLILATMRSLRLATGPLQELILKDSSLTLAHLSGISPTEIIRLLMLVMNGDYDPMGLLRFDAYMLIFHYLKLGDDWGNELAEGLWAADDYTPHVKWVSSLRVNTSAGSDLPDEGALFSARQTAVSLWETTFAKGPNRPTLAARAIHDGIIPWLGELSLDPAYFNRLHEAVQALVVRLLNLVGDDASRTLGHRQVYRLARRVFSLREEKPLAYKTWTMIFAGDPNYAAMTPLHEQPVCNASECRNICNDKGEDLLACSRCKKAMYCSGVCQKRDWKRHKPFCATTALAAQVEAAGVD